MNSHREIAPGHFFFFWESARQEKCPPRKVPQKCPKSAPKVPAVLGCSDSLGCTFGYADSISAVRLAGGPISVKKSRPGTFSPQSAPKVPTVLECSSSLRYPLDYSIHMYPITKIVNNIVYA
jgi:hypothetical protein